MAGIGQYRHRVTLANPGTPVPDGDGGYTEAFTPLDPPDWDCAITPVSARSLETLAGAATVLAQATHSVRGRHHPGITTETRLTFNGRTLSVLAVANPDERDLTTELVCTEVVP
jgi:head-tail adaptor